ncbi:hypothetical protein [Paenibacillus glucanolyticus]|uniref:hypothetical protein n=1 Tax=Paenibacillus glucanolyticus TaxID=59843 RepID=UPI00096BDFC8|nr:hypothetical protein [Paenibacillus glucanolyticus]OMF76700.1 hypothetical protein BK142_14355 [Paenibacillus glucanolyticus]
MTYTFKPDDMFYDVMALNNVFIVTWWLPNAKAIIFSYLDDNHIIQSEQSEDLIREYIYQKIPNLRTEKTEVIFENIANTGFIREFNPNPNEIGGQLGMQSFAKRLGLTNASTYLNAHIDKRDEEANGVKYDPAFYPVKHTDPDYDENRHGYRFGYNSKNYHMTLLAELLTRVHQSYFTRRFINSLVLIDRQTPLSAASLRDYHNELMEEPWRNDMPKRLVYDKHQNQNDDYSKLGWMIRKGWLLSGRYIDVARLNEKSQGIELKRLLAALGLQIKEAHKVDSKEHIDTLEEFADRLSCCISDVLNLQTLFEQSIYQKSFNIRGRLLVDYPQTIYGPRKGRPPENQEAQVDTGNYLNVRKNRLTRDSTSASFIEYAIAPYKPIRDFEKVSFMYPSEIEAKKLGIDPTDILEDTKAYFEKNVTSDPNDPAYQDFMEIYRFYAAIRGRNFNSSKTYQEHYPNGAECQSKSYINELMSTYNTNLFYYRKDENGRVYRSSCFVNFSIGGIHGAEINLKRLQEDQEECKKDRTVQDYVESLYPSIAEALKAGSTVQIPDHLPLPNRLEGKISEDRKVKLQEFTKFGSLKPDAVWRDKPNVDLFKKSSSGSWTIQSKYTCVSAGASHHQDFESFYPLLLSRLSVFVNPSYHGYKENGEPTDPYFDMYLERAAKKEESRDQSLPDEVRYDADIEQDSRKLLINSATGMGDAKFDNHIRANNAIISMRIIGQLFAWRIGQAQTLAGARVPSTNTDGLYTMDISAEENQRILKKVSKNMYIKIDSETLDRFVSKDSNNRLETHHGKITSAKGSTLSSWEGPQLTQNLDHPAIIDYSLANYLANEKIANPVNIPFNRSLVNKFLRDFINEHLSTGAPQAVLKYFQWIISSSSDSHRYVYTKSLDIETGEMSIQNLPRHNRVFMIKDVGGKLRQEVKLATRSPINKGSWDKRYNEYQKGDRSYSTIWDHDEDALQILLKNGFDLKAHNRNLGSLYYKDEAKTQKIKAMPDDQQVAIFNNAIIDLPNDRAAAMIQALDLNAYADMVEKTFLLWSNL